MKKKVAVLIIALVGVILFFALIPISVDIYTGAYYVLLFNLISIISFALSIYCIAAKNFKTETLNDLMAFVIGSAIPHLLFAVLSYGSWVCLGISVVIVTVLIYLRMKYKEEV